MEVYALAKRTGKTDEELMSMETSQYYELYLTDKSYNEARAAAHEKLNRK